MSLAPVDPVRNYESGYNQTVHAHEISFAGARLSYEDVPWLELLRGATVDEALLDSANNVVALGSVNLSDNIDPIVMSQVVDARKSFFGDYLNWSNPGHTLNGSYAKIQDNSIRIMPLATVIESQRILYSAGLNNQRLTKMHPMILSYGADSISARIENYRALGINAAKIINALPPTIGFSASAVQNKVQNFADLGLNGVEIINAFPFAIGYAPDSLKSKISYINRIASTLNWSGDNIKLIEKHPAMLGYSRQKLRAHIRMMSHYATADISEANVFRHVIEPLEAHIIDLVNKGVYEPRSVAGIRGQYKGAERKSIVMTLLRDQPALEAAIGKKVVRNYLNYTNK